MLLVVLDRKVVTLGLDFKEVVRSDLLEFLHHISCSHYLCGFLLPKGCCICAFLGCCELPEHLSLILKCLKEITSQLGFVVEVTSLYHLRPCHLLFGLLRGRQNRNPLQLCLSIAREIQNNGCCLKWTKRDFVGNFLLFPSLTKG